MFAICLVVVFCIRVFRRSIVTLTAIPLKNPAMNTNTFISISIIILLSDVHESLWAFKFITNDKPTYFPVVRKIAAAHTITFLTDVLY